MSRLSDIFGNLTGRETSRKTTPSNSAISAETRVRLRSGSCYQTPLENMQTRWGLVSAWWQSDQKLMARAYVAAIIATSLCVVGTGIAGAYVAGQLLESFTEVVSAAYQNHPELLAEATKNTATYLGLEAGLVGLTAAFNAAKDISGKFMHRNWRNWLGDQLEAHLLEDRRYVHLLSSRAASSDEPDRMPDNIDQRIQESVKNMTGSVGGLAMGAAHTTFSVVGFGGRLAALSVPVSFLPMLGSWGFAALAVGASLAYVAPTTYVAYKQAQRLKTLTDLQQTTEGDYRAELNLLTRNADQIAASNSEDIAKKIINKTYEPVDTIWKKFAWATAVYAGFLNLQSGWAARVYSYLPSLPGLLAGDFDISQFQETSSLTRSNIDEQSWVIKTLPDWANLGANIDRVTDLTKAMLMVKNAQQYYARSGIAELKYASHENGKGVILEDVELMHKGKDKPFIKAGRIHFQPGRITAVMGPSGCGKTTLVKTIMQLHPYGRGRVTVPENATALNVALPGGRRALYATQEAFLPEKISLKQLVCLPADENDPAFDDVKVAAALEKVGLGKFIGQLKDDHFQGKCWKDIFSGGQKQLAVLARIILHKPDILILDEGVSALDARTKIKFHELLKQECPDTAIVSIIHDPELLDSARGPSFYDDLVLMKRSADFDDKNPLFDVKQYDMTSPGGRRLAIRSLRVALGMDEEAPKETQGSVLTLNTNKVRAANDRAPPAPNMG